MRESPETLAVVVGGNVRTFREDRQLSQRQLAEELADFLGRELPKQVVSKIELGRRSLSAEELIALAQALDVTVTELLTTGDAGDEKREVELSSGWRMTLAELHHAVAGDSAAAAAAMKVRQEVDLVIQDALHAHIASEPKISRSRKVVKRGRKKR